MKSNLSMRGFFFLMAIISLVFASGAFVAGASISSNQTVHAATEPKPEELVADYLEERLVEDYVTGFDTDVKCEVYNADELSRDILEHRDGKVIIERCIGKVTDAEAGYGIVLNAEDNGHNYISYRGTELDIRDGTMIVTFLCYDPETNGVDDILDRYDFILSRGYE